MSQAEVQDPEEVSATTVAQAPRPAQPEPLPVRRYRNMQLLTRMTGIACLCLLAAAFLAWILRPGHYRLVLLILILAMFLAVLHNYFLEDIGGPGRTRR